MDREIKYRVSTDAGVILIMLAGVADLATLVPVVGNFLGWSFWVVMAVVFWKLGLGLVNFRKLASVLISTAMEFIPFIQALPTITAAMAAIIFFSRIEDKTGLKILPSKGKPGITKPKLQRNPVNSTAGIRQPRNSEELYTANE
jgi:hypothetical protein